MSSGVRVIIQKAGGVSAITTEPMQAPPPKEGEVRIKVAYAGINFADLLMRLGFYQPRPPFPFTPGYEVSGVIDALGKGVTGLEMGQKVVAAMRNGGQASFVLSPVDRVIPLPDDLSLQAAASTPVTYMTAHHMLHHLGHLRPEDKVLVHGGAVRTDSFVDVTMNQLMAQYMDVLTRTYEKEEPEDEAAKAEEEREDKGEGDGEPPRAGSLRGGVLAKEDPAFIPMGAKT